MGRFGVGLAWEVYAAARDFGRKEPAETPTVQCRGAFGLRRSVANWIASRAREIARWPSGIDGSPLHPEFLHYRAY
jgi:hypothetical protein